MLSIICVMFAGMGIGFLFRKIEWLQKTEKTISYTIFAMLFILGISVGSNPLIIQNIGQFGWQAAILAVSSLFGSILAAWAVYNLFFKKGGKRWKTVSLSSCSSAPAVFSVSPERSNWMRTTFPCIFCMP